MELFLNIVLGGLLIGGIYSLVAMGLSLQYGVARVLNIAHGEFLMFGAFITFTLQGKGIDPLVTIDVYRGIHFVSYSIYNN
jgi:branched-chain amino acid transport system permease protein